MNFTETPHIGPDMVPTVKKRTNTQSNYQQPSAQMKESDAVTKFLMKTSHFLQIETEGAVLVKLSAAFVSLFVNETSFTFAVEFYTFPTKIQCRT